MRRGCGVCAVALGLGIKLDPQGRRGGIFAFDRCGLTTLAGCPADQTTSEDLVKKKGRDLAVTWTQQHCPL